MSSWRIKVGNDPTVEEWLKAQKSKSGSVQFLIKIFAHLHGNSDITKMSFNELFETGDVRSQRYRVTDAVKVGAIASTGERSEKRCEATATKPLEEPKANTGETKVRTIVNTPQIGESKVSVPMEKVVAATSLPVEKKSQEQREPSQKEKKKDNMLLSML